MFCDGMIEADLLHFDDLPGSKAKVACVERVLERL